MTVGCQQGFTAFQRGLDHAAQRDALLAQRYFAAGQALDIEQVINQERQIGELPLHRATR